jgi:hypothetical protein
MTPSFCHSEPAITLLSFRACRRQARNLLLYEWQIKGLRFLASLEMTPPFCHSELAEGRRGISCVMNGKKEEIPHFVRNDRTCAEGDPSLTLGMTPSFCHSEPAITLLSFRACRRQARNLMCYEWQKGMRFLTSYGMTEKEEQKGRRFLASLEMTRGGEMSSSLTKKLSHMPLTNYTGQQ